MSIILNNDAVSMLKKYHMRKSEREITNEEEILDILRRGRYVVLAISMDDEPYVLTLSYGFDESSRCMYFHTASEGMKMKIINNNPKACGTVIEDLGYIHGECSHKYRSAVLYGMIEVVPDLDGKKHGMMTMFKHLEKEPAVMRERFLKNDEAYSKLNVLKLVVNEMTGKESS